MKTATKAAMIQEIISQMRLQSRTGTTAERIRKGELPPFDAGDLFFTLAFRTDTELRQIAKSCGIC